MILNIRYQMMPGILVLQERGYDQPHQSIICQSPFDDHRATQSTQITHFTDRDEHPQGRSGSSLSTLVPCSSSLAKSSFLLFWLVQWRKLSWYARCLDCSSEGGLPVTSYLSIKMLPAKANVYLHQIGTITVSPSPIRCENQDYPGSRSKTRGSCLESAWFRVRIPDSCVHSSTSLHNHAYVYKYYWKMLQKSNFRTASVRSAGTTPWTVASVLHCIWGPRRSHARLSLTVRIHRSPRGLKQISSMSLEPSAVPPPSSAEPNITPQAEYCFRPQDLRWSCLLEPSSLSFSRYLFCTIFRIQIDYTVRRRGIKLLEYFRSLFGLIRLWPVVTCGDPLAHF